MWGAGPVLLFVLVVLHAFQPLAGKVLKDNVVIAGGRDKEDAACLQGQTSDTSRGLIRGGERGSRKNYTLRGLWDDLGQKGMPAWPIYKPVGNCGNFGNCRSSTPRTLPLDILGLESDPHPEGMNKVSRGSSVALSALEPPKEQAQEIPLLLLKIKPTRLL